MHVCKVDIEYAKPAENTIFLIFGNAPFVYLNVDLLDLLSYCVNALTHWKPPDV